MRDIALGVTTGSQVTIDDSLRFIVRNPVARLVNQSATVGAPLTMSAVAVMRNES